MENVYDIGFRIRTDRFTTVSSPASGSGLGVESSILLATDYGAPHTTAAECVGIRS